MQWKDADNIFGKFFQINLEKIKSSIVYIIEGQVRRQNEGQ